MRQKRKAEALQPRIPEAPIFKLGDGVRILQFKIHETPIFELSDVVRTLQLRIYEALVFKSDDEDIGLDLFG